MSLTIITSTCWKKNFSHRDGTYLPVSPLRSSFIRLLSEPKEFGGYQFSKEISSVATPTRMKNLTMCCIDFVSFISYQAFFKYFSAPFRNIQYWKSLTQMLVVTNEY